MKYVIVCPRCGNSEISMDKSMIGLFECNKCKNVFDTYSGNFGFNDIVSDEKRINKRTACVSLAT